MPQEKMEGGAYCRITPQIRELTRQWDKNAHIDRQLYEKYDVKRGLRDATGRGVLTSLTRMAGWSAHLCVYGRKIGGSGVPARFPPEPGGKICRIF